MLLAATFTAIGFAFDAGSGNKQLTFVFAAAYFIGCVLAVLAVRQNGIFTTVIQPPLLLFVSVPTAYFLFTSGQGTGLKDILINCGYPLIERFPLMFFTSAAALLVGMGRWYQGMSARKAAPKSDSAETAGPGLAASVSSKLSSLFTRAPVEDDARRRRTATPQTQFRRVGPKAGQTYPSPAVAACASPGDGNHRAGVRPSTPAPRRQRTRVRAASCRATPQAQDIVDLTQVGAPAVGTARQS